jgi:hypothetical protein
LRRHQHDEVHEDLVSRTILEADCPISIPKLKTHQKTGLTANLKNLMGINGNQSRLPHHRVGTLVQGGDQYADCGLKRRLEQAFVSQFKRLFPRLGPLRPVVAAPVKIIGRLLLGNIGSRTIHSGNWFGTDTLRRAFVPHYGWKGFIEIS